MEGSGGYEGVAGGEPYHPGYRGGARRSSNMPARRPVGQQAQQRQQQYVQNGGGRGNGQPGPSSQGYQMAAASYPTQSTPQVPQSATWTVSPPSSMHENRSPPPPEDWQTWPSQQEMSQQVAAMPGQHWQPYEAQDQPGPVEPSADPSAQHWQSQQAPEQHTQQHIQQHHEEANQAQPQTQQQYQQQQAPQGQHHWYGGGLLADQITPAPPAAHQQQQQLLQQQQQPQQQQQQQQQQGHHQQQAWAGGPAQGQASGQHLQPHGQQAVQSPGDGSTPFMHYEDYSYFDTVPKDDERQPGIRDRDTFSIDDGRPKARRSWRRQQKKKKKSDRVRPATSATSSEYSGMDWLAEIIWCCLSIICVGMIVVVLRIHEGRALPTWPLGITLNTLVAFLTTICRAAFVIPVMEGLSQLKWNWFATKARSLQDFQAFDDASRGPYGSIKLLFTTKGRLLGMSAAVVLLTGLVTSPLTQSVIAYPTRYTTTNGTATLARSVAYDYPDELVTALADLGMPQKQAIQQGIYNPAYQTFQDITPTCSTGDCQFSNISTLAVCVSMSDVTSHVSVSKALNASSTGINFGLGPMVQVRNASLPNGAFIVGGTDTVNMNITVSPLLPRVNGLGTGGLLASGGGTFLPAKQTLAFSSNSSLMQSGFADLFILYTNQTQDFGPEKNAFRALEVLFHFCVNTYSVNMTQGVANTSLVGSVTEITRVGAADNFPNGTMSTPYDPAASYLVTDAYVTMLTNYVTTVFSGIYSDQYGSALNGLTATSDAIGTALYKGTYAGGKTAKDGDDAMRGAFAMIMQNVATSLTNAIRLQGTTGNGTTLGTETYVEVRWGWLAFLAAQVGISAAFLVAVMVQTALRDVKVIKGSALATLFAVTAEDKAYLEGMRLGLVEEPSTMLRRSRDVLARFHIGARGWVLDLGRREEGVP